MSEKVVSLHTGKEILTPGELSQTTISLLEKLLLAAKSGEIHGVVAFINYSDGASGVDYNEDISMSYQLVGRMLQVTNEFANKASHKG